MALELIGRVGQSVPVLKDKVAQASPWYIVPAVRKHAAAQGSSTESLVTAVLNIEQIGTTSRIHTPDPPAYEKRASILYRIDVPYRTELTSRVSSGKQLITGILGPVNAVTNKGDIGAAYISNQVEARVGTGNLDLQVGFVQLPSPAPEISLVADFHKGSAQSPGTATSLSDGSRPIDRDR